MVARFDLVPGEIIHNKVRGCATFDDLVACMRSANGERARTRRPSCDQPRRRVFHHETCHVESVLSPRATDLSSSSPFSATQERTVLWVYSDTLGAGEVRVRLWLATLDVVGSHVTRGGLQ